jgi:hypothetical protein
MRHRHQLELERSVLHPLPGRDGTQVGFDPGFFDAGPGEGNGQRCPVDRHVDLREQVRQRPDVVLVPVGQDDALKILRPGDH